jgi:hypothetical protein
MDDSVTVSIAALMIGMRNVSVRVRRADVLASRGSVSEYRGTKRTSSNVMPSLRILSIAMGKNTADVAREKEKTLIA